jgi:hypothetical protein
VEFLQAAFESYKTQLHIEQGVRWRQQEEETRKKLTAELEKRTQDMSESVVTLRCVSNTSIHNFVLLLDKQSLIVLFVKIAEADLELLQKKHLAEQERLHLMEIQKIRKDHKKEVDVRAICTYVQSQ